MTNIQICEFRQITPSEKTIYIVITASKPNINISNYINKNTFQYTTKNGINVYYFDNVNIKILEYKDKYVIYTNNKNELKSIIGDIYE